VLGFHPKNVHCLLLKAFVAQSLDWFFFFQINAALLHKHSAQNSLVAGRPEVVASWPPIGGCRPTLMACRPEIVPGWPLMMHYSLLQQRANRAKKWYSHRLLYYVSLFIIKTSQMSGTLGPQTINSSNFIA